MKCLGLIMPTQEEQIQFLDLCGEGDVESVKTLLAEDPSLINSKESWSGKVSNFKQLKYQYILSL